jgi:hypothetical protein
MVEADPATASRPGSDRTMRTGGVGPPPVGSRRNEEVDLEVRAGARAKEEAAAASPTG